MKARLVNRAVDQSSARSRSLRRPCCRATSGRGPNESPVDDGAGRHGRYLAVGRHGDDLIGRHLAEAASDGARQWALGGRFGCWPCSRFVLTGWDGRASVSSRYVCSFVSRRGAAEAPLPAPAGSVPVRPFGAPGTALRRCSARRPTPDRRAHYETSIRCHEVRPPARPSLARGSQIGRYALVSTSRRPAPKSRSDARDARPPSPLWASVLEATRRSIARQIPADSVLSWPPVARRASVRPRFCPSSRAFCGWHSCSSVSVLPFVFAAGVEHHHRACSQRSAPRLASSAYHATLKGAMTAAINPPARNQEEMSHEQDSCGTGGRSEGPD
jgi:hypothetical protein